MKRCTYIEVGKTPTRCSKEATHVVNYGREDHPLCAHHARPKFHPPDLRPRILKLVHGNSAGPQTEEK